MTKNSFAFVLLLGVLGCTSTSKEEKLPVLGRPQIISKEVNGQTVKDTIPHQIADFSFLNQDSVLINNDSLKGKAYVADFFFTSCPTICPSMKKQLIRVHNVYQDEKLFSILSHTIDPKHDTIPVLKEFAERLGVSNSNWHFLYGSQDEVYPLGEKSYMMIAGEDANAPGGYIHSGAFILVDDQKQIRGVYDGTDAEAVDLLITEIDILLNEIKSRP